MNELQFNRLKEELLKLINHRIEEYSADTNKRDELILILGVLNEYSYNNRLMKKSKITHILIDSLSLDNDISEKLIFFDMYL